MFPYADTATFHNPGEAVGDVRTRTGNNAPFRTLGVFATLKIVKVRQSLLERRSRAFWTPRVEEELHHHSLQILNHLCVCATGFRAVTSQDKSSPQRSNDSSTVLSARIQFERTHFMGLLEEEAP